MPFLLSLVLVSADSGSSPRAVPGCSRSAIRLVPMGTTAQSTDARLTDDQVQRDRDGEAYGHRDGHDQPVESSADGCQAQDVLNQLTIGKLIRVEMLVFDGLDCPASVQSAEIFM